MQLQKILIVEDSPLAKKMYQAILRKLILQDFELLHAAHGRAALDLLHSHPDVDLVLLDINMPIMSGLEFLQYYKKEDAFKEIPVIIISTKDKDEDVLRGLEAGAQAYIKKPFQPDDLYQIITQVLSS